MANKTPQRSKHSARPAKTAAPRAEEHIHTVKSEKRRSEKRRSEKREARSEKREARSEKREARSEKREARSEKREARSETLPRRPPCNQQARSTISGCRHRRVGRRPGGVNRPSQTPAVRFRYGVCADSAP